VTESFAEGNRVASVSNVSEITDEEIFSCRVFALMKKINEIRILKYLHIVPHKSYGKRKVNRPHTLKQD